MKRIALLAILAAFSLPCRSMSQDNVVEISTSNDDVNAQLMEASKQRFLARGAAKRAASTNRVESVAGEVSDAPSVPPGTAVGVATVLRRRAEMKRVPKPAKIERVGDTITTTMQDGSVRVDKVKRLVQRGAVSKAADLAAAKAEAVDAIKAIGRAQLKANAKATDAELLALGVDAASRGTGGAGLAGGALAGFLAGVAASKLKKPKAKG